MKFFVKVAANRLNPFVVIKTKKNSTTFLHILASRDKMDITYGIRAKLKHSDLMDSSTCRYVVNYVI